MMSRRLARTARGSAVGNILTAILVIGLLGLGGWLVLKNRHAASEQRVTGRAKEGASNGT